MQCLGRSSSTIPGEPLPPNGEVLARWSSQEEEHAHTIRKRVRSWGVRRTKLYAFGARVALKSCSCEADGSAQTVKFCENLY